MSAYVEDTIAAIATAAGPGAISILRVSGVDARAVAAKILRIEGGGRLDLGPADSHRARTARLVRPDDASAIDECLVIPMLAPRSYTGEDTVEVHCHGGSLIGRLALRAALAAGARAARPGEFTERAFLNGKLDLCQAEAVADMIDATSEVALESARRQLAGELSAAILAARDQILDARALVEAHLDFPEEDLPAGVETELTSLLGDIAKSISELAETYDRGRALRDGLRVVLAGKPNVGKSSLLNALLGRERALVSEEAGTTRDYLEEPLALGRHQVLICDTAGVREADGSVERAGVERTREQIEAADVVVFLADGSSPLDDRDRALRTDLDDKPTIWVRSKSDLPAAWSEEGEIPWLAVSAQTGAGLDGLVDAVTQALPSTPTAEGLVVTNARHFDGLLRCGAALEKASDLIRGGQELELVASDLQQSCAALDELVGRSDVEDVLDRVFSRFCVGK